MPTTSQRINRFTESVIRRMTGVANAHAAINLSRGFPDFDPPEALLKAAECTGRNGPHQYAVTWGVHLNTVLSLGSRARPSGGCGGLHRARRGYEGLVWSRTDRSV